MSKHIAKEDLEPYIKENLPLQKIADILNVSYSCIQTKCIKYNLKTERMENREKDLTGMVFGRLTVLRQNGRNKEHRKLWLCKCSCINNKEINIPTNALLSGNTKSCGCIASEIIVQRNKNNKRKFSDKEKKYIIECYISGESISYIENKFNISDYMVKDILFNENIPIREKIIPFNENYFNNINTGNKAYWLGFLYADGCVNESSLELGLQNRDKNHIQKFLNELNADIEIKDRITKIKDKEYKSNRVILYSRILVQDLINKGCLRNKSSTIRFPNSNILPEHFQSHFIRGYFDGDGCVGFYNNKDVMIDIISNENFLLSLQEILVKKCGVNYTKLRNHYTSTKVKYLKYGGSLNVLKIYNYMYNNATIFLDRKYDKFQIFINFYNAKYNNLDKGELKSIR